MESFAHQTLFRRRLLPSQVGATAVLHVGRNWSRLEIGNHGNLLYVRVIKASMENLPAFVENGQDVPYVSTSQNGTNVQFAHATLKLEMTPHVVDGTNLRMTFASALRSTLRQDPDVVLVGEIRDAETAAIATQAALTGHKVLSTVHTNDAAGAVMAILPRELNLRPHCVTYLCIVLIHHIVNHKPRLVWLVPVVALLWVNIHGMLYPILLLLCGAYLAEHFLMGMF